MFFSVPAHRKISHRSSRVVLAISGLLFSLSSSARAGQEKTEKQPETLPALVSSDTHLALRWAGHERTFLVHIPKTNPKRAGNPLPLLVMLHGAGGSGEQARQQTGWDKKADKEGFVAVFPDALPLRPGTAANFASNPRVWEDGSNRGEAVRGKIDDEGFIEAVLADVEKREPIDTTRVYVTGFSSGASMTFTVAASPSLSKLIAAAAPVAGHFWNAKEVEEEKPDRVVPLLLLYGSRDPVNPWNGGPVRQPWGTQTKPKVMTTVGAWAKFAGCPPEAAPLRNENGVKAVAYGPGRNGTEFIFTTIDGMGHVWPGGKERLPARLVGSQTSKLNGTEAIWTFLSRHHLTKRDPEPVPPSPTSASPSTSAPSAPASKPQ